MKVAFALAAHSPNDERVFYQQAKSLQSANVEVAFVALVDEATTEIPNAICISTRGLSKRVLVARAAMALRSISPDVVICDNPFMVIAAHKSRTKCYTPRILYDVTEWYPSKKNLREKSFAKNLFKLFTLPLVSLYSATLLNGFIFGEYYKALPFRILFPWKEHIFLPYYSPVEIVRQYPVNNNLLRECRLFYSGRITHEKGFFRVVEVAKKCAVTMPSTHFVLDIIAVGSPFIDLGSLPSNLTVSWSESLEFVDFCSEIGKSDIYFDIRNIDLENTRCLPIKLFYYMACGRPVVYSDLRAIRKEVPEIESFGKLVNPDNFDEIVSYIKHCVNDFEFYSTQCQQARSLAVEKYDWKNISALFVGFVTQGC